MRCIWNPVPVVISRVLREALGLVYHLRAPQYLADLFHSLIDTICPCRVQVFDSKSRENVDDCIEVCMPLSPCDHFEALVQQKYQLVRSICYCFQSALWIALVFYILLGYTAWPTA